MIDGCEKAAQKSYSWSFSTVWTNCFVLKRIGVHAPSGRREEARFRHGYFSGAAAGLFEGARELEDAGFPEMGPKNLHADGKAEARLPAGDGNPGDAG